MPAYRGAVAGGRRLGRGDGLTARRSGPGKKRNYARSNPDYVTDNSGNAEPLEILVTEWHKHPPKASEPWRQSKRLRVTEGDHLVIVGFNDDGNEFSYENAVVTATRLT